MTLVITTFFYCNVLDSFAYRILNKIQINRLTDNIFHVDHYLSSLFFMFFKVVIFMYACISISFFQIELKKCEERKTLRIKSFSNDYTLFFAYDFMYF